MPSNLTKPKISKQNELCLAFGYSGRNISLADSCRVPTGLLEESQVLKKHKAQDRESGARGHTGGLQVVRPRGCSGLGEPRSALPSF